MDWGGKVTYIGKTAFRDGVVPFGIKDADRLEHFSVMGKAGSGRATLFAGMALQDIERGMSVVILDASGNLVPMLLERLSESARERLVFLDPSDGEHPFSWNPINEFRPLGEKAVGVFSEALASMYRIAPSALTEYIAEFSLARQDVSALCLYNAVADSKARDKMFGAQTPESIRFEEIMKSNEDDAALIIEHGRYIAKDTLVRNVLGQTESKFSLAQNNAGAVIVVDMSRIRMFPTRITPLVRIFTHAARARGVLGENTALYLYDCLKYLSEKDIELILPERKVACAFASTPQNEEDEELYEKAFRRCGSVLAFAPHPADFSLAEKIFYPYVSPEDLSKLKEGEMCVALTIDSVRARPFFAMALPRPERTGESYQDLQTFSREKYTTQRVKIDALFKAPKEEDPKDKGKGGEPGSFSDTFRSIFNKRTATPTPGEPAGDKKADASEKPKPKTPDAKTDGATKKEDASPKKEERQASEIPEDDLRQMLHVEPISGVGLPA